ncbi:hypothetical protein ACIPJ1_13730 [Microbacterium maritypicum]|uniref:hypothetical protein n=1 Tax=Microbacterium maritypicum TaxID=33918 RepID=UPI0038019517
MATSSAAKKARSEPISYFTQRCLAWLVLAGVGNLVVLGALLALSLAPVAIGWDTALEAIGPFVLPAYSPALLFFTVFLTILERGAGTTEAFDAEDHAQANRLIANGVRLALTVVMSFATLVVILEPTALVHVLFAVLLGFIAIVRAELIAPPKKQDAETVYRRAVMSRSNAARWANGALGPGWEAVPRAVRVWPTLLLLLAAPVLIPAMLIVATALILWGPELALAPPFLFMSVLVMVGPEMLVLVWLSTGDKSESPRARGSRAAFLLVMSFLGTAAIASPFLFSGKSAVWIGIIIVGSAVTVGLGLRASRPRWLAELRHRAERKWTAKRLASLTEIAARTESLWAREQVRPPLAVRVLALIFRPFRQAYHLAGKEGS